MKIVQYYSHLNGYEHILVPKPHVWQEISRVITAVDAAKHLTKVSKEKTMAGRVLYAPKSLNAEMRAGFAKLRWAEKRTTYWVIDDSKLIRKTLNLKPDEQKKEILAAGKTPLRSYNQTDFVKDRVEIEVQFGKYSFVAFDLFVKHMAFFVGDVTDVGVEIVPMKSMQQMMSSGPPHYEGCLYDLLRQGRSTPAVPLVLIGVAP
ncbi:MAG TPA: BglII/BstYI family type II restriction endonuclease [Chthonomonadaceae bacterium]|nr:BglII/BstYI family type II restriction endonuclease [Chthonomonadaceae bacterium]